METPFLERIEAALDLVRGRLAMHGGGMELVAADEASGEVSVRFRGACVGCPLASLTLGGIVEDVLGEVPGVRHVTAVSDDSMTDIPAAV